MTVYKPVKILQTLTMWEIIGTFIHDKIEKYIREYKFDPTRFYLGISCIALSLISFFMKNQQTRFYVSAFSWILFGYIFIIQKGSSNLLDIDWRKVPIIALSVVMLIFADKHMIEDSGDFYLIFYSIVLFLISKTIIIAIDQNFSSIGDLLPLVTIYAMTVYRILYQTAAPNKNRNLVLFMLLFSWSLFIANVSNKAD